MMQTASVQNHDLQRSWGDMGPVDWCEDFSWPAASAERLSAVWEDIFVLLDTFLFEKQACPLCSALFACDNVHSVNCLGTY